MGRPATRIIPGTRFGRLVVGEHVASTIHRKATLWSAKCDCGKELLVIGSNVAAGNVISCGCARLDRIANLNRTHGMSGTPTYKTWLNMKERCHRIEHLQYAQYGGRGIRVCERWHCFENFLADMGERPAGHSIDRIDNDRGYEPGNCRWATPRQQARNTRQTKLTEMDVLEILGRVEHGESQTSVARRFGLRQCSVSAIVRGQLWAGVS